MLRLWTAFPEGWLIAFALMAGSNCIAQTFPSSRPATNAINIICIGDSITECKGIPDRDRNGSPAVLARLLAEQMPGTTIYLANAGISGTTTADWSGPNGLLVKVAEPKVKKLLAEHPDGQLVFSIMLGTNDSAN
ncbi:MAG: hypothetical protein JWM57_585, partial [Phycisphaerales bacterium]|nr:hypothetical protein [Phycisphaerales bacterium]